MIEDSAYLESVLDEKVDVWYNEGNDKISERTQYEEDPVYLSRQEMNKSENPDESSLFGMLSPEFTTILLP